MSTGATHRAGLVVESCEREGVMLLKCSGRMVLGSNLVALRDAVISIPDTKIVIDLEGVSIVDSAGLGELVGCATVVRNRGGRLKLLKMPRRISELVKMARLETMFEMYESEDAALGSFVPQT